jgi:serine/threonine-protein kinase
MPTAGGAAAEPRHIPDRPPRHLGAPAPRRSRPAKSLNERYRIIGRLGRGGMGEVFRADDLKLGQPVSLKFLPRALAATPGLLERFHAEVRNARHVSHPNVCRVYDIGEIDGQHFLTMEFVDGEDLATLLRRIGRLPAAKANEVARQLCAGVAAAHDKGVLHRDLKPSNVMLDGDGRVRITDFGSPSAERSRRRRLRRHTRLHVARAVRREAGHASAATSTRSGSCCTSCTRAGGHSTRSVSRNGRTATRIRSPRRHRHAAIHSTKRRSARSCAASRRIPRSDPRRRCSSRRRCPGGDPVAAALAAGETPSPEMVAASGGDGALSPRSAWMLLGLFAASIVAILALAPHATDLGLAPLRRGPEVLRARAREILAQLGLDRGAVDSADWFDRDYEPMQYLAQHMPSTKWRPIVAAREHRRVPLPAEPGMDGDARLAGPSVRRSSRPTC